MTDWNSVAEKFALIFGARVSEIRMDIPVEEIVEHAVEAVQTANGNSRTFPVQTEDGVVDIPVEGLVEVITRINNKHKETIRDLASRIGIVIGEASGPRFAEGDRRLVGEEADTIALEVEGMVLSVEKDVALKVVSLGILP